MADILPQRIDVAGRFPSRMLLDAGGRLSTLAP